MEFYQTRKISPRESSYDRERHTSDLKLNNNFYIRVYKAKEKISHNW